MVDIHKDAQGRWKGLLLQSGIPNAAAILAGKHMPCPMCGGTDRFRYSNFRDRGDYYCSKCGSGTGVDLLMKLQNKTFLEVASWVRGVLHVAPVEIAKATSENAANKVHYLTRLWRSTFKLEMRDPASLYLRRRGIDPDGVLEVRHTPRLKWSDKEAESSYHPAMVTRFLSPDSHAYTVHTTYLTADGCKAPVAKPKKLAPAPVPKGGAVRLCMSGETLGIAEGIETALSAQRLFDVPVWACLTAGELTKWQPPAHVKCVMVFGDNDSSYTGQCAAFSLAHRLKLEGRHVDVRIPDEPDTDWNDVLVAGGGSRF
jgi:putative DNA primase/helicase